jgi:hypothetical protein
VKRDDGSQVLKRGGYITSDTEMTVPTVPAGPAPGAEKTETDDTSTRAPKQF